MKERAILFSAPMVRALLAGLKTQTRRIVKPRKDLGFGCLLHPNELAGEVNNGSFENSPWSPGDRLWVREAWRTAGIFDGLPPRDLSTLGELVYEADGATRSGSEQCMTMGKYRPPMFMPRWASRITLEIVSVRVERLQDITEADAIAEGLSAITKDGRIVKYGIPDLDGLPGTDNTGWPWCNWHLSAKSAYQTLWDQINGDGSWSANPWVWVIEFKKVINK